MDSQQVFKTDSFLLASYLLSLSCKLVSTDKSNKKRVVFIFSDSEERGKLTEEFFAHKSLVEPHKFFAAQKDLKQLIYS